MAGMLPLGREAIEKKGWWHAHKWLLLRRLSQLSILALFLLGPLAGIWIITGNLSGSLLLDTIPMTDPLLFLQMLAAGFTGIATDAIIGAAIVLVFYILVGGRVFCSWVCPVNIVTDAAFWLRRKLGIKSGSRISRQARYWILGVVLILSAVTGSLAYELVNPVSMLHRGLFFGMGLGWALIAGVFLFDLFVANRGWCSHLCPMGAFYGLVGQLSPLKVRADARSRCDDCNECFVVCPEPQIIPPVLKGEATGVEPVIASGVCTNCGRCIDVCAEEVFHFGWRYAGKLKPRTAGGASEASGAHI
ncbi:MAG: quinol dehydrogenase ferredoxin subunit NapH [Pseudomonadota bacterium]|nr:quinol dehydrogenase ferredoxin subunit NapH [Pseudomonadota bacterium]